MIGPTTSRLKRYARRGHRRVEGWIEPGAFDLVRAVDAAQRALGVRGAVGEIGVHHGQLIILLYLLARGDERALAVDLFERQELNPDGSGRGDEERFRANLLAHAGDASRLVLLRADSRRLAPADLERAAGGKLRLLSVDGGHTAEVARSDLALAAASLVPGGVVLLDDYFHPLFPGVSEGTNDFMRSQAGGTLAPFAIGANKLFFTTPDHAARHREALALLRLGASRQERELFGWPVLRHDFDPLPWRLRLRGSGAWRALRATPIGALARAALRATRRGG